MVGRGHVPVQRTAERHVCFSTEATMLAGDPSGSRTVLQWVNHQLQQDQDY